MVRAVWVAGVLLAAASGRATADARLTVRGACEAPLVEARVAALMGRDPFAGGDGPDVEVEVEPAARQSVTARVQIGGAARQLAARGCGELADAIALVVALAMRDAPVPIAAPRIELAPPPPVPVPAPSPARPDEPAEAIADEAPPRPAREVSIDATYSIARSDHEMEQRVAGGASVRLGRFSLGVEVRRDALAELAGDGVTGYGRFGVTRFAAAIAPCVHAWMLSACALAIGSRTRGEYHTPTVIQMMRSSDASGGGRLALDARITSHAALRIVLDVEAPFTTTRFEPRTLVWTNPRVEGWLGVGLAAHFP